MHINNFNHLINIILYLLCVTIVKLKIIVNIKINVIV